MAEGSKSGVFFGYSTVNLLADLDDAVAGRLVKRAFAWLGGCEDADEGEFNGYEKAIWGMMRKELEENRRRWEEASRNKSESALRRWARESADDDLGELKLDGDARKRPTVRWDKERCVFEGICKEDVRDWKRDFPDLDVEAELAGLERWFRDNPAKRWRKNIRGHIGNCLARTSRRMREKEAERSASQAGGTWGRGPNTSFEVV